jgi:hypothetical protein
MLTIVKEIADLTVIVPVLIGLVVLIVLTSAAGSRFGWFTSFFVGAIGAYGAYKLLRRGACNGTFGRAIAARCARGQTERALASAVASTASGLGAAATSQVGKLFARETKVPDAPVSRPMTDAMPPVGAAAQS